MKRGMTPGARAGLSIAAALAIAGCSASGTTPLVQGNGPAASAALTADKHTQDGKARFEIRIPKRERRHHYVSPNTQSLTIDANGTALGSFNVSATAKGCKTVAGSTQCMFTVGVPTGKVTFSVSTFSLTNGTGSLLSQGSVTQKVLSGQLAVIPLTLEGAVASIALTLGDNAPPAGIAASIPVYVTAFDASGAVIIGPGNYTKPVALTNTDATGITALSTTSIVAPGTKATLTYNGRSIRSATIGAGTTGITPVSATFVPKPRLFASYASPSSLKANSQGLAITSGPDGNLWYTVGGTTNAIVKMTTAGVATAFLPGTTPNLTSDAAYTGITSGPDHNLWFTENTNKKIGRITPAGVVTEFATTGGICPQRIIAGPAGDGGLWFTSSCTASIGHIATTGAVTSFALAGGGASYRGIMLSRDGHLYVTDLAQPAIGQVTIAAGQATAYSEVSVPANSIDGSPNSELTGIAQTADGQLWFTNNDCTPNTVGSVTIATPFSASAVHEFVTLQGCSNPGYMAVTPDGGTIFEAIGEYPVIEGLAPAGIGIKPLLTDYAVNTKTPNDVFQQELDATIGPDGNVWTVVDAGASFSPDNVLVLAY
jgi:streptogramin lyase